MDFQPMSPEEMQRMMQFLLNQQAQFAADAARREEEAARRDAEFDARMDKLSAKTDRVVDGLLGLTAIVGQIAAAQQVAAEELRESRRRDDELGDYIKAVEAHLNVVIDMFERHLREDHGRPPS